MTGAIFSLPVAAVPALLLIPLIKPMDASRRNKRISAVIFIPAAALTAANTSYSLAEYVNYASLPNTPRLLTIAIIIAVAFFLAAGEADSVKKWADFTLPLTVGFIVLAIVLLAGKFNISGLAAPRLPESGYLNYICEGIALLGVMPSLGYKEKPVKTYLSALLGAFGVALTVWTVSSLTLGAGLAGAVEYPFHNALRVAKGGEILGRMEAFLLPVALCVALLKTAACMVIIMYGVKAWAPRE
jgi:hypothetical protein